MKKAEMVEATAGPAAALQVEDSRFKLKKGSVFPAKRRSVKKMIFDDIVHSIFSCFGSFLKSHYP
ncbi:Hypothetical predicted protein [Olea europaea subsp. europaea]|uniref:Uncharacterized protein n=1 Tax=Olea europaea subsp. europaea TaxID=158383 RepID=A0A8S0SI26_OLEEU|nr:Hypothetical predicted protein [Olea europaea subsp. europaea]